MQNNRINGKANFFPSVAFHSVMILLLLFLSWKVSDKYITISSIPWGVISILLAPIGNSIALYLKLNETKKNVTEDISRAELRRLDIIVNRKRNFIIFTLILQLMTIALIAIVSLSSNTPLFSEHVKFLTNISISAMIASLYTIFPSILGIKDVFDFEAKIKHRKVQGKRMKQTLEKLAK